MKLELCSDDLKPEFKRLKYQDVDFQHFNFEAQKAIFLVKEATYRTDNPNYSIMVYVPEDTVMLGQNSFWKK